MLKRNLIIFSISIILLFFTLVISLRYVSVIINSSVKLADTKNYYGYLIIPKIEMEYGFYNYGHSLNDVSKNIELIKTDINNTYLIAAHSGTGSIAYFNDLKELEVGDDIFLRIKEEDHYVIKNIRKEKKNGSINIKNEENQLILTTCDQEWKGYQLIIEAKIVEKS